jgi:aminoglycoside 6'-N-acetyltransferase I
MSIVDLAAQPENVRAQAAALLVEHFDEPYGWRNIESARDEVARILREGFGRAMLAEETVLGWVGGLPEYDGRVWELHPLVVRREKRLQGIGRALVAAFESEAQLRGGLTVTLGADDFTGMTSLGRANLYQDLPRQLAEARVLKHGHSFAFYLKLGFVLTGVMPDANGPGRPDIFMSKSIQR